ncbi:MAG: putative membrane protein of unknown function [Candidatus Ozemobacter sibiricus]|uniref:Glycosyltransferase RgtA/B/C/D-like domain-containing protein n=1 Tax=Candidatus Ozemobacter sibiricus TaxID=2268124 RepID=A0A367ZJN3_9BACT|nr:MAG: putative membrane protein of unknown function [Candidatus Ozemobacter sibiricus]
MTVRRRPWIVPWLLVGGVLIIVLGRMQAEVASRTGGGWVYPLDDTYIHLAMARTLGQHGVWGITPAGFTPSTSSLLWTALLALGGAIGGHWEQLPLVFNLAIGLAMLALVANWLSRGSKQPIVLVGGLLAFLFITPLPTLAAMGMEHLLHLLLCLVFLRVWEKRYLANDAASGPGWKLLLLASLVPAVRYEGLFLVAAASLIAWFDGRWRWLLLIPAAWVIIGGFGIWSMAQGWMFLPTSVLVKSALGSGLRPPGLFPWFKAFLDHVAGSPELLVLMIWAGWTLCGITDGLFSPKPTREYEAARLHAALFLLTALQHLAFAEIGYLFRYEGYLVGWGLVLCLRFYRYWWWQVLTMLFFGLMAYQLCHRFRWPVPTGQGTRHWLAGLGLVIVVFLIFAPLGLRGMKALPITVQASVNIHDQQIQMGRFVREGAFGPGAVAVNDLGAVAWLGDREILDVWGLATLEVAKAKRAGTYGPALVEALANARQVTLAMVYPTWMQRFGGIPPSWTRIGSWTIADNVICGEATVEFYAVASAAAPLIRRALGAFTPNLPRTVKVVLFDLPARSSPDQGRGADE